MYVTIQDRTKKILYYCMYIYIYIYQTKIVYNIHIYIVIHILPRNKIHVDTYIQYVVAISNQTNK